jgi:hypothetical protein
MNKKQPNFATRLAASLMTALMVFMNCAPLSVSALDIQALPDEARSASGFTHAARVTWDDLNASDNSLTTLTLMTIPTNAYIDRVAFYIEEPFTNTVVAGTNLALTIGITGTTNRFFGSNCIDGASIQVNNGFTVWMLSTNLLVPYKSTTDAVSLLATLGSTGSTVDNYTRGKLRIYWRVVAPARWRF